MDAPKTLQQAIQFFSDYENCRQFMVAMRWEDGVVRCPRCNSDKVSYLEKHRLYFCPSNHPKQKFSLKVGTVFEDSPIGLEKWLPVTWLLCNCKNGISSYEIARAIGVTQKSAWFMLHRVRKAMEGKRPKFPSGATTGMRAMMSSWWMKREREPDVAFAGFDRYQRSGGLRS
jgi:transposase-like protein